MIVQAVSNTFVFRRKLFTDLSLGIFHTSFVSKTRLKIKIPKTHEIRQFIEQEVNIRLWGEESKNSQKFCAVEHGLNESVAIRIGERDGTRPRAISEVPN